MYCQQEVEYTWIQGTYMEGFDPEVWRFDKDGRLMKKSEYGRKSYFGWKIFCVPGIYTGGASLLNLFPKHWRTN